MRPGTGTRIILYGWECRASTQGVDDVVKGGYFLDSAVASGSVPNAPGSYISSINDAFAECMAEIRRFQKRGIDAEGDITYKIFGQDAGGVGTPGPVRPLASGEDDETVVCRIDYPEASVRQKVNLANRLKDSRDALMESQLPQDLGTRPGT